ncbi:MAG: thiolase family protein, partial [Planctomycetes bacterium]|nr:thiolase family protein [Planctomycetota bacterium]
MLKDVFLAGPARTPIGAFCGALADVPAPRLGAIAVRASLERAGIPPGAVDEVVMGNVVGAGLGQNVARQCAIGAGVPVSAGATTVNRVCGSGLKAVMMAAQAVQLDEAAVVVAGGTESMSRAPYLLEKARGGYRMGHGQLVDSMLQDGLTDACGGFPMGTRGDATARKLGISREEQDDYAARSFRLALEAAERGWTAAEIVPVEVPGRKGTAVVTADEGPARFHEEKLRKLQPAFGAEGTVTAGNASSINDGAAAIAVLSAEKLKELGVKPVARILGYATFSREPEWFTLAPVGVNERLMQRLGLSPEKVDVFEINEAFAVVVLAAVRDLRLPLEKVNPLGGAIALGHPIGASGCRTLVTMLNGLRVLKGRTGIV